ncbi:lytic transglycosylase domain-containing protein [Sphingomonas sp. NFR15]|uniref:lytic transglycosylase domain-containing protein n=1 Tax=Sphingomonas sp. NFR15 TaxID=1566282 RepID=UPI0035256649
MTRLLAASLLSAPPPAHVDQVERWRPIITNASARFGIPARWIERVMRAESRGLTTRNGRPIRSPAGAIGLMQLMPATWQAMRRRLDLGTNPDDPRDNILAGTCFLRLMYDRFGYPGLFGAYNAGPAAYAAFLAGRRQLPSETIAYLATVDDAAKSRPSAAPPAPQPSLFLLRRLADREQPPPMPVEGPGLLFAIRKVAP